MPLAGMCHAVSKAHVTRALNRGSEHLMFGPLRQLIVAAIIIRTKYAWLDDGKLHLSFPQSLMLRGPGSGPPSAAFLQR